MWDHSPFNPHLSGISHPLDPHLGMGSNPSNPHLPALICRTGCNPNFSSLHTVLFFPQKGQFCTAHLTPSPQPPARIVHPIPCPAPADPISVGPHPVFSQLLLTVTFLLVSNGNTTTFRIPLHLLSSSRGAPTPRARSAPGLGMSRLPGKPPPIKHSAGNSDPSCIPMNTTPFTPLDPH